MQSVPFWEKVIDTIDRSHDGSEFDDYLLVLGATSYGRFCIETAGCPKPNRGCDGGSPCRSPRMGLGNGENAIRACDSGVGGGRSRAGPEPRSRGLSGDRRELAAHDVSRCWLYFGLIALSIEKLDDADERFGNAERHWREIEKPLHIHRILLQRSWVDIFRGDFDAARSARKRRENCSIRGHDTAGCSTPASHDHIGSIWRRMRWPTRRMPQRSWSAPPN